MIFHKTSYGETWDVISLKYYGTEKLMHLIIQANPQYADYSVLPDGLVLKVPFPLQTEVKIEELPPWKR